jgi:hypothetical protein
MPGGDLIMFDRPYAGGVPRPSGAVPVMTDA